MIRVPFHRRTLVVAGAAIAALAVSAPPVWAHIPQTAVKAQPNPIREFGPAVTADYFAWQQTSKLKPHHYNVFAQPMVSGAPSGLKTRVNIPNSVGYTGGIAGTRLVYQQVTNGGRQSDIGYFSLVSHVRHSPPAGVNTTRWEYDPRISSGYLLFGRNAHQASHIILWNLADNSNTTLLTIPFNRKGTAFADTGQTNGDYATFWACTNRTHCSVYLYTISTATLTPITPPAGLEDYDSAVSSTGTLYFARGGFSCGVGIQLMQLPLGGSAISLNAFHSGTDLGAMQTFNDGANDQVLYSRAACATNGSDIYQMTAP
jgi:hypothetical protein